MTDKKLKEAFDKYKVINPLKQPKFYRVFWVNQKFKIVFLKSKICIAMNVKVPAVNHAHSICKNVQVS